MEWPLGVFLWLAGVTVVFGGGWLLLVWGLGSVWM